jgi:hypothetical protein
MKLTVYLLVHTNNCTSIRTDEDLNLWEKIIKKGATLSHVEKGLL